MFMERESNHKLVASEFFASLINREKTPRELLSPKSVPELIRVPEPTVHRQIKFDYKHSLHEQTL